MHTIDRKQFLLRSFQAAAGALVAAPLLANMDDGPDASPEPFAFTQLPLPYAFDALEPSIDRQTMELHYTRHHAGYVKKVAAAITEEGIAASSAEEFFANVSKYSSNARNNGGGAWNHNFFWQVMRPEGQDTRVSGRIADALTGSFGSVDEFMMKFAQAGMKRFGSGWAWLVLRDGKLEIGTTPNQDNPLMDASEFRGTPLLALDVWEHAYYLKYQNKRDEYIGNWWRVVNWNEVARRLG